MSSIDRDKWDQRYANDGYYKNNQENVAPRLGRGIQFYCRNSAGRMSCSVSYGMTA